MTTRLRSGSSVPVFSRCCSSANHTVGTAALIVTRSPVRSSQTDGAVELRAREDERGAGHRRREGEATSHWRGTAAPPAGRRRATTGRACRAAPPRASAARSSGASRRRPSGCRSCPRCSTCRRRCSRRSPPRRSRRRPRRATPRRGRRSQARLRHVRRIGQHHVALDAGKPRRDLLDERHEGEVDEEQPVLGVVDDPGDLVLEEPRIDRVVDGADADDAVPGLEMPPGVPGERRDPVAEPMPSRVEALRDLERAPPDLGVVGAVDRPLDRARDRPRAARAGRRHDR